MIEVYKKLQNLLDFKEKKRLFFLFLLMIIMGIVEAIGTASIMPFIVIVSEQGLIDTNKYLVFLYTTFGFKDKISFIVFFGSVLFLVVVFGFVFRAYINWILARFVHMCSYSISSRLLKIYLSQPYSWFLNRHSANMGRQLVMEVHKVSTAILLPFIQIVSNITGSFFLITLLILVNPVIALSAVGLVAGTYVLVYIILNKRILKESKKRGTAQELCFQIVQEALGGIKEIKVFGLEDRKVVNFDKPAKELAKRYANIQVISDLPQYFFQAIAFGGIVSLLLILVVFQSGSLVSVLPLLALYAFAGFRLIPAFQRIYSGLTVIKSNKLVLFQLHEDYSLGKALKNERSDINEKMKLKVLLELNQVSYSYPKTNHKVIKNLNLKIAANTKVGFMGTTGSGKTTTVDLILGLLSSETGEILVDNVALTKENINNWQNNIGYVPQHIFLTDDTIAANIAFGVLPDEIDHKMVKKVAQIAELDTFITEGLESGYNTKIGERGVRLSGGQRQRLGIARALYRNPDILILDEATSALDNLTEKSIMDTIDNMENNKTIIIIAHRLNTIKNCETIFVLKNGALVNSGTYDELMTKSDDLKLFAINSFN